MKPRAFFVLTGAVVALLCLQLLFEGCSRNFASPTPPDAPQAAPPVTVPQPIRMGPTPISSLVTAVGNRFSVDLVGAVPCCDNPGTPVDEGYRDGWPLQNASVTRRIADAGGNYTHVRPTTCEARGCGWSDLRRAVEEARGLGVVVEIDILDVWALRTGPEVNVLGGGWPWVNDSCAVILQAPKNYHRKWVYDLVAAVGDLPNVIYQVGNESNGAPPGRCASSIEWEAGIADAVHEAEAAMGLPRHLVGTQHGEWEHAATRDGREYFDYTTSHRPEAQGAGSKPRLTNEYNDRSSSPEHFRSQIAAATRAGTYFALWRGEMSDADFDTALGFLRETSAKGRRLQQALDDPRLPRKVWGDR